MKKLVCLIIALTFLMIPTFCVSAETTEKTLISVANAVSEDGYEVTVRISTDYDCAGLQAVVKFDSSKITYAGETADDIYAAKGKVSVSKTAAENINGKWFDLKFKSNKVLFAKDFTVSDLKGVKVIDGKMSVNTANENYTCGDTCTDGVINLKDLVRIKKISADIISDNNTADCDLSGKVDANDIVTLKKLLLAM